MGKFRELLDEAKVILKGKKKIRKDVPTHPVTGEPLSATAQRIIKQANKMRSQSGFKLRTSLASILDDLRKFKSELEKNKSIDSVKYKYRKNFEQALLNISSMVVQLKNKGLKAVENKNEDMELWESLEIYCQSILHYMKK